MHVCIWKGTAFSLDLGISWHSIKLDKVITRGREVCACVVGYLSSYDRQSLLGRDTLATRGQMNG